MQALTPPIVIIDGRDLDVLATVAEAQQDLEPIDIQRSQYVAYDAQGRLLRLETDGKHVKISLAEAEPTHAKELEVALREFLKAAHEPVAEDDTCNIACLIEAASKTLVPVKNPKARFLLAWRTWFHRRGR